MESEDFKAIRRVIETVSEYYGVKISLNSRQQERSLAVYLCGIANIPSRAIETYFSLYSGQSQLIEQGVKQDYENDEDLRSDLIDLTNLIENLGDDLWT